MSVRIKYPRTYHFPWSPGLQNDDRRLETTDFFMGQEIVVTTKMDGECTTIYQDHIHARSIDSGYHESRDYVKGVWGRIKSDIPEGFRVCGENLYAQHSIPYDNLEDYFLGFSVWNGDICLGWTETQEWFSLLGIESVPVLYEGIYDEDFLRSLDIGDTEGYVVRLREPFTYEEFNVKVGKYVRKNHIQTSEHWMTQKVVPNKLKGDQ